MFVEQFLSLFPYKKLVIQPNLEELDVTGLPVSFIEDYKVIQVLQASSKRMRELAVVWLFDDKYLVSSKLISFSMEFFTIHNWVSKRLFNGELNCFTLLEAGKIFAYLDLSQDRNNAIEVYAEAKEAFKCTTIDELNKEYFCFEVSSMIDDLEYAEGIIYKEPVKYGNKMYYLIVPWALLNDDRFELKSWGLLC